MENVRAALWPVLERTRKAVSPAMQVTLFSQLSAMRKEQVVFILQAWRAIALTMAQAKTARARQTLIERHAHDQPHMLLYAAAAWTARTLALAEYLDRATLHELPKQWAAEQAFLLMDQFESDDGWLWPFDTESPWSDRQDDNADS